MIVTAATATIATIALTKMFGFHASAAGTFYSGKHVLITGGSSGIGKELARLLLSYGASVTLVARNEEKLLATVKELAPPSEQSSPTTVTSTRNAFTIATTSAATITEGPTQTAAKVVAAARVNTVSTDCSDMEQVERMADHVETQFGVVDILVNCCGSAIGGYFEQLDHKHFEAQMKANYFSHVYPTQAFFKRMARRRAGHIVFVSSMAGQTGVFGQAAYCPSKYAVRGLAETLYFEGKPFNINITIVYPPDTDTPGLHEERKSMPPETVEISDTGGLFSPAKVAQGIADGVRRRQFRVTIGLIGYLLGILSAGLTPNVSPIDVVLVPITRAITPLFLWDQNATIRKGFKLRYSDDGKQE